MKRAFTLLELMVACLLLGMLVTVMTMVFNQSSIAWRTGRAGVIDMSVSRTSLGAFEDVRDDVLPGLRTENDLAFRTVSLWKDGENNQLRFGERAFAPVDWTGCSSLMFNYSDAKVGRAKNLRSGSSGQSVSLFTVGVRSAGPDGVFETADDVSTWPEDVE